MHFKKSAVLLSALAAGGVVAHGHGHQHHHKERAVGDTVTATIDGKVVTWKNNWDGKKAVNVDQGGHRIPVETSSSTSSASKPKATGSGNSANKYSTSFGGQTEPTGDYLQYCGNIGVPYGSNIILVRPEDKDKFDYTIEMDGSLLEEPWEVVVWNKCGPERELNGFFQDPAPLTFTLNPGTVEYVALDKDTQGGFAGAPGAVPRDQWGNVNTLWGEFDFGSDRNQGWSGYDVSAIVPENNGKTDVPGLKICDADDKDCSTITTNLAVVRNAYLAKDHAMGGIGGNKPPGPLHIKAIFNYNE